MTVLGWASASSVDGYTRISEDAKVRGFVTAMDKVEQQHSGGIGKQVLNAGGVPLVEHRRGGVILVSGEGTHAALVKLMRTSCPKLGLKFTHD